jgi:glycosyltransferase involved in cell wall biosynthesis
LSKPSLAVITCIKNEGEDLVEWLAFHRHCGVSAFVIYDNLSTDATRRILDTVPFRDAIEVRRMADDVPQRAAFADAIRRYRDVFDWVAFIDGDEYIVPLGGTSLLERLAEHDAAGVAGFGINWRIFGSNGHAERPPGLVTESFTARAPDTYQPNRHVKSIVKIGRVVDFVTVHYFRVDGCYRLDGGKEPHAAFNGIALRTSFTEGFAIHHYITKSEAQCRAKIARGRPWPVGSPRRFRPPTYWETYDRNDIRDDRAARVIAPIRDEVLRLRDAIGRD